MSVTPTELCCIGSYVFGKGNHNASLLCTFIRIHEEFYNEYIMLLDQIINNPIIKTCGRKHLLKSLMEHKKVFICYLNLNFFKSLQLIVGSIFPNIILNLRYLL